MHLLSLGTLIAGLALAGQEGGPSDLRTRKAGADWPDFLGPRRDGRSTEKGLPASWPERGPRVVWTRALGESFGTCTTRLGRLFHFDRYDDRARLTCMKSETGEELWRFEYATDYVDAFGSNNGPRCSPVVDDDRVYIFDMAGLIHCVRTADGSVVWKKDTSADFGVVSNFFGVGSTPIVEGDLLIALVGGSPPGSPPITSGETRGNGTGIVAFDKKTGEVKYRITDELASYSSPATATIGGRRWGFVYARGALIGFEPATGKVDFEFPWRARMINSVNICNPVVVGDTVFVSEAYGIGGAVVKVRPGGYDIVWQDGRKRGRSFESWWNTPIHVDGNLYGSSGMQGGGADLRCVEAATGKVRWTKRGLGQVGLVYVDGHFIGLGEDGALRLIKVDPDKYVERASVVLRGEDGNRLLRSPVRAAPVLSHGLLYVRGSDRLACLDVIPQK